MALKSLGRIWVLLGYIWSFKYCLTTQAFNTIAPQRRALGLSEKIAHSSPTNGYESKQHYGGSSKTIMFIDNILCHNVACQVFC